MTSHPPYAGPTFRAAFVGSSPGPCPKTPETATPPPRTSPRPSNGHAPDASPPRPRRIVGGRPNSSPKQRLRAARPRLPQPRQAPRLLRSRTAPLPPDRRLHTAQCHPDRRRHTAERRRVPKTHLDTLPLIHMCLRHPHQRSRPLTFTERPEGRRLRLPRVHSPVRPRRRLCLQDLRPRTAPHPPVRSHHRPGRLRSTARKVRFTPRFLTLNLPRRKDRRRREIPLGNRTLSTPRNSAVPERQDRLPTDPARTITPGAVHSRERCRPLKNAKTKALYPRRCPTAPPT